MFINKKNEIKAKSLSHLVRKRVLESEIYEVDLKPFIDMKESLKIMTDNLNQITKRVNTTGIIYNDDVKDMKRDINNFSEELRALHDLLLDN